MEKNNCRKKNTMESIRAEWEAVKDVPSLFKHYGSQKEYQRWRDRFVRAGYLSKGQKLRRSKAEQLACNRSYYEKWRAAHRDKVKKYTYDHWMRKLGCVQTGT
jgi:hypothetical protein